MAPEMMYTHVNWSAARERSKFEQAVGMMVSDARTGLGKTMKDTNKVTTFRQQATKIATTAPNLCRVRTCEHGL
jgi:hypothetical protein